MTQAIADPSMPLEQVRSAWTQLRAGLDRVLLGQDAVKERVLTALLAGGHVLVEGPPGTGKTLVALALSRLIGGEFRRIQFTPDLMPVDLLGTNVFEQRRQEFVFVRGPVFTDVLLADEVNRTPPRTQSALLEAMQERAVTVDGQRHTLSPVFFVLATQNPVEYEGTYPLPEAQKDRFLLQVDLPYPAASDELALLRAYAAGHSLHADEVAALRPAITPASLATAIRAVSRSVRVEENLLGYIRNIVAATRDDDSVQLGAGPRAALALLSTSRALAAIRGRDFVSPDEVKELAPAVLVHRITLTAEAEMEGTDITGLMQRIFERVEVPR